MAIDREETKNLLFGGFQKSKTSEVPNIQSLPQISPDSVEKLKTPKLPKWKTFEKVTVLLTSEQKDCMDDIARKLMRFRHKERCLSDDKERITANSVVRGILENVLERIDRIKPQNIHTEEDLKVWISQLFIL